MNDDRDEHDRQRRHFLGAAAAGLGFVAIAPGIRLIEMSRATGIDGASSRIRWGMLIDATKCADGCSDCVSACAAENHIGADEAGGNVRQQSQWIRKVELVDLKSDRKTQLPMMCQHCANPPCVDVCPTGASFKRADGIVLVDRHICIGCRYCMMACPYKARSFVHAELHEQNPEVPRGKGCVEGCTMCVHRIDKGQTPACVESCKQQAMLFGDLNDPNSNIRQRIAAVATDQVRADLRLDPGVRYQGI
jgi:tetrathionate reductase subunit B